MSATPAMRPAAGAPRSRGLVPLYLTHAMVHLAIGLYPAVLIVLRTQFHVSYALLGGVFTAAMFVYGFGALPVGLLLDRVSPLLLVRLSLAGFSFAVLAVAVAPNEIWFAVALLLLGLACAPYHTAALTLVSRLSGNDPRLLGHHGMMGNLGLASAPLFGGLLAWAVSWRLAFAGASLLGFALLLVLCTRMPTLPAEIGPDRHRRPADRSAATDRTHLAALVLVLAITAALGFIYRGVATYLPALVAQRTDLPTGAALLGGGALASAIYFVGFFGQWWGGHLGGRRAVTWIYALLLAATAVLLAAAFTASGAALVCLLAVFSFVHFTTQPLDNVFTGRFTSHRRRGVGYGLSFGISFGLGSLAAWTCGLVADAAGGRLQYVLLPLAGVAAVAALLAVALAVVARRSPGPTARGAQP